MALPAPTPTIAIADLQPNLDSAIKQFVSGIITLIWPYASSTKTISLLLVEPDFRLRRHRGQVRIYFVGPSAKALAKAGVASGDQLILSLNGVNWVKDASTAITPGKSIDWELRYGDRIEIHIQRPSSEAIHLDVEHLTPSPEPQSPASTPYQHPPYNSHIATSSRMAPFGALIASQAWSSPAFLKRGQLETSSFDPFLEDEEFPDNDRRKKTKFGRGSGQWRFAARTPSPEKEAEAAVVEVPSPSKSGGLGEDVAELGIEHPEADEGYSPPLTLDKEEIPLKNIDSIQVSSEAIPQVVEDRMPESSHQVADSRAHDLIHVEDAPDGREESGDEIYKPSIEDTVDLLEADLLQSSLHDTADKSHQASPLGSGISSRSSVNGQSDSDMQSDGDSPEVSDANIIDHASDGLASAFGLDGALLSRARIRTEIAQVQTISDEANGHDVQIANDPDRSAESTPPLENQTVASPNEEIAILSRVDSVPGVAQVKTKPDDYDEAGAQIIHDLNRSIESARPLEYRAIASPSDEMAILSRADSIPGAASVDTRSDDHDIPGTQIVKDLDRSTEFAPPHEHQTIASISNETVIFSGVDSIPGAAQVQAGSDQAGGRSAEIPENLDSLTESAISSTEEPIASSTYEIAREREKSELDREPMTRHEVVEPTAANPSILEDDQRPLSIPLPSSNQLESLKVPVELPRTMEELISPEQQSSGESEEESDEGSESDTASENDATAERIEIDDEDSIASNVLGVQAEHGGDDTLVVSNQNMNPVEIIDLESDDEDEGQVLEQSQHPITVGSDHDPPEDDNLNVEELPETEPATSKDDTPTPKIPEAISIRKDIQSETGTGIEVEDAVRRGSTSHSDGFIGTTNNFEQSRVVPLESIEGTTARISEEDQTFETPRTPPMVDDQRSLSQGPGKGSQLIETKQSPPKDLDGLPATLLDSYDHRDAENQLLTPSTTQKTSFVSQPSTLSLASIPDQETLPTPQLSQGAVIDVIPFRSSTVEREAVTSKDITVVEASQPPALKHGSPPPGQSRTIPIPEAHNVDAKRIHEKKLSEVEIIERDRPIKENAAEGEILRKSLPTEVKLDAKEIPKTPSRRKDSALVQRLKAMRSAAARSPHSRLSDGANAVSPWFTPRRSSQIVPDSEAETGASGSEDERRSNTVQKASNYQMTPDKSLAKSFVRSTPQRVKSVSTASSPQYLPPSQPTIGGFRTNLSYFVPLAALPSHYGTTTDILAIAISSTSVSRATTGPKDHYQTIYLTDPSSVSPVNVTTAQIFRPNTNCFPQTSSGDAVLLRNFKVQSFQKRFSLIDTDSSAWAVFHKGADVQVRGPPIEYGAEERAFARGHWNWWASLGSEKRDEVAAAIPDEKKAKAKKASIEGVGVELPGSQSSQPTRATSNVPKADSKERSLGLDGAAENVSAKTKTAGRVLRPRNGRGKVSESPEKEDPPVKHELRDGTIYVDEQVEPETQNGLHELRTGRTYRDRK